MSTCLTNIYECRGYFYAILLGAYGEIKKQTVVWVCVFDTQGWTGVQLTRLQISIMRDSVLYSEEDSNIGQNK